MAAPDGRRSDPTPDPGPGAPPPPALKPVLGLFDVTMIVMGCIVGAGIFFRPQAVAVATGSTAGVLAVWGIGGVIALTGAFVFAELAAMFPRTGGQYVFVREPFGRFAAFMFGWLLLTAIVSSAVAGVARVCVDHAALLLNAAGVVGPDPAHPEKLAATTTLAIATTLLVLLTLINMLGVRTGATVHNVAMVAKVVGIAGVIALGVVALIRGEAFPAAASISGNGTIGASANSPPPVSFTGICKGLIAAVFAYGGWQNVAAVASEVKEPQRTLPRGMVLGTIAVVALYLTFNLALVAVLGVEALANSSTPTADAAFRIAGQGGRLFVAALVTVSTLAIVHALLLVTPRIYYAMAKDGLFFRQAGYVHPKWRTPAVAIALQGGFALVHLYLGNMVDLFELPTLFDWLFFSLCGLGLFVLRVKRPDAPRPYRATGYPWLPGLFLLLAPSVFVSHLVFCENSGLTRGAWLAGSGLLAYFCFTRFTRPGNAPGR